MDAFTPQTVASPACPDRSERVRGGPATPRPVSITDVRSASAADGSGAPSMPDVTVESPPVPEDAELRARPVPAALIAMLTMPPAALAEALCDRPAPDRLIAILGRPR